MIFLLVMFWQTWWFGAGTVLCLVMIPLFVNRKKIKFLNHGNNLLHQQLEECKELLKYAKDNEQKALEESEILSHAKSLLLSKLSHEIRTPMNGIIGMASLLGETSLTQEQKEYAQTIGQCGENLMTVINNMLISDVLDYTNATEERTEIEYKDFHLPTLIEDALDSFADKVDQSKLELIYYIDQNAPLHLVSDPLRLKQVLMNVLENAVKFTVKGEIFVGVHLLRTIDRTQVELGFEIKDTGLGFPAREIDLLNKDITTVDAQHDSNILGLLICKKLLALMGGCLKIESKEGSGTLFKFTIVTRISLQPLRPVTNSSIEQKQILVVEDNYFSQTIVKRLFDQWKLNITLAGNGEQALKILSNKHFDLIIVDMEMPHMTGIQLMNEIRRNHIDAPAILLTSKNDDRYKKHPGLFRTVLTKPIKHSQLFRTISEELTNAETATTVPQDAKQKISPEFAKKYPLRILIAEDNVTNQQIASMFLKKLGYESDIAKDGQEALEIVSEGNYDLIFMDVQMPVMDGIEATRMIRLCLTEQPVIIAMTANAMQGDKQACLQAGMDDYISKPIKLEEMSKMLEQWAIKIKDRY
jgi:CheY-like chemotaxis protein/signal transduction histidine kinase